MPVSSYQFNSDYLNIFYNSILLFSLFYVISASLFLADFDSEAQKTYLYSYNTLFNLSGFGFILLLIIFTAHKQNDSQSRWLLFSLSVHTLLFTYMLLERWTEDYGQEEEEYQIYNPSVAWLYILITNVMILMIWIFNLLSDMGFF